MARRIPAIATLVSAVLLFAWPAGEGLGQQPPGFVGQGRPVPPAQQPRSFFDLLFGPRQVGPPPQTQRPVIARPEAIDATPVVEVTPKDPKARKILVIGDFVAGGLAWGLDQTLADEPKLAVIDESNVASGLVRDDYFDWSVQLPGILNKDKPDIVVAVFGANDRQQIREGRVRLAPHSEGWEQAYVKRIAGIADTLKVFGRPFFWISAPPMRATAASRDMAYLNDFFKPPVTSAGGHFIDIWNGFTDDNGNFISSGPDVDGQLRALRSSDGINFTRAGRLKLAFYVAREIRKTTGIGAGAVDLLASVNQQNQIEIGKDGVKHLVGPVISLTDPLPGASDVLAGGAARVASPAADTPQVLLIVKGVALPVVQGRADDFSWPPRQRSVVVAPLAAPATPAAPAAVSKTAPPAVVPARPPKPPAN